MEGVLVHPGDIVFGDIDGVCIVPWQIENDVIHRALEKVNGEKKVQKAIEQGMSACDAFEKYGIM
jgi:regulator of RNase E activity RraA